MPWWLKREIALVQPGLIIALGATAAFSLTGNGASVLRRRGTLEHAAGLPPVFITVHPSSVLRAGAAARQDEAFAVLVADLKRARAALDDVPALTG